MKNILIIAGEVSSDMHAANLVRNIKSLDKDIGFSGLGGDKMQAAGVELLFNTAQFAFIGPGGLFKNYLTLRRLYNNLCRYINDKKPDCVILIDYAEFNLRVARYLKKYTIPVIYYISPQVWAWGLWRIYTIKEFVDKMLVLFEFEEKLYRDYGIEVSLVGHPLLDMVKPTKEKSEVMNELGIDQQSKIVGLLPGSRVGEIKNILPVMLKACKLIPEKLNGSKVEFVLPLAPTIEEPLVKKILNGHGLKIRIVRDYTYNALSVCNCAMVASGTATLETALMGVPMAIIYKANILTYIMVKNLIRLPFIGIVNIISGERIVPEFLQYDAKPKKIAEYMIRLLEDKEFSTSIKEKFTKVKESLGGPGASLRAAKEVMNFLNRASQKCRP